MNDQENETAGAKLQPEEELTVEEGSADRRRTKRRRSGRPEIPVNLDELRELIDLVREHEFTEFELSREDFRIRFRRGPEAAEAGAPIPAPASAPAPLTVGASTETRAAAAVPQHPGARAETEASEDQDLHMISSPIVGTFYRSPSPNAESFVKIGTTVEADTVVCIIEAMKLMNEIQAETSGEVVKIYVENGQPVEYGQPLFGIKK
ncbi:MAG TPA: acetyl-CoA carboxylase biotin carboxyl carrier protein [Pyrinomonadaceae bacterium]|nr:acetyl-CoA carboxylase biotin carboxyl carrier protein [Pyrinomonadaceae bacterium]